MCSVTELNYAFLDSWTVTHMREKLGETVEKLEHQESMSDFKLQMKGLSLISPWHDVKGSIIKFITSTVLAVS